MHVHAAMPRTGKRQRARGLHHQLHALGKEAQGLDQLLVGGHDTTASQIGCTLLTLLARPSVLAAVRSEPALLAPLVSETIRFEPATVPQPRPTLKTSTS